MEILMEDEKLPIKIEIEYEDEIHRITDPIEIDKWWKMVISQATMAHVHGHVPDPPIWSIIKKDQE
jgi:hypothetical protein